MKTLLLLRHAKSSRDNPALEDHDRPLNSRGKESAKRVGKLLHTENLLPDLILSSTAVRARKTAQKAAKQCGYTKAIQLDERLYLAPPAAYFAVIRETPLDRRSLLIVGHNPGLSEFFNRLLSAEEDLPTAALARIELPLNRWKDLGPRTRGKLIHLWRPRELD